ncbi:MAG: gamma-carboxygeranoyl-CoA hydratase [Verrucomicrobia bacterium TMED44]|nr:MAG: gamma-carboxygeranoyl-CoA hydratase [Verrucomicrobia bacterium TMED44]
MSKVIVKVECSGVARVTLNNPQKHNAFNDVIIRDLTNAFSGIASNPNVRVMILSSFGKNFSSGADLAWMKKMATYSYEENLRDAKVLSEMFKTLHQMPQPTIVRIQGAAMGGALGLISCCDIALAEADATFALSEVKIGLIPATISPYVVPAIGSRAARRYFVTGERFSAYRAKELGLVSEVLDKEELDPRLDSMAAMVSASSPQAAKKAKALVSLVESRALDQDLIDRTCDLIADIRVSDEGQEGLSAFLEKRPPNWLGH